jgi:hypothetical protein
MIPLNETEMLALFRHHTGELWVGDVHMMNNFFDMVPFALAGKRYVAKFLYPKHLNGIGSYTDSWLKTRDDGVFLPQREHRILSLLSVDVQGELLIMPAVQSTQVLMLAEVLYQVVETYARQNGMAVQFFFETKPDLGNFIRNILPSQPCAQNGSLLLTFHDEVLEPFYGMTASLKLTA